MSEVIPGIQGVPFKKVVKRDITGRWPEETLSCGHKIVIYDEMQSRAVKRRCYALSCRIKK